MKNTGIIRRIDDLGRVVIPKEIRRTFNIHEGDPLEIHIEEDIICFKKYVTETSYVNTLNSIIKTLSDDYDIDNNTRSMLDTKLKEAIGILKQE